MFATGKWALGTCDRCGGRARYSEMVPDGHTPGLRVHSYCRDIKHPSLAPVPVKEGIALKHPRPDPGETDTVIDSGTAQAGSASGITLASTAPAIAARVIGHNIEITGGTGSGQTNSIAGYNGTTKVAAVSTAWATVPDATSTYEVTPAQLADAMAFDHTFGGET